MSTRRAGRPPLVERAQAQRERILTAAERCFIEHGFHAASMSTIATTAGMSAGLIYRYFDSKSAIIQAIVARQLEEKSRDLAALHSEKELGERVLKLFRGWKQADPAVMNAALFLEMSAQATRDSELATALAAADRISTQRFREWLRRQRQARDAKIDERDIAAKMLVFQCFVEGMAIRAVRDPDIDDGLVAEAIGLAQDMLA